MLPMTRFHHPRRLIVAATLCLLALGACGGEDEADDAGGSTTETTAHSDTDAGGSGSGGDDGGSAATEGDAVAIEDFQYKPENLKVKAGTKVTFTNKDEFAHTVTAKDKSYDSENMDKDAVFEHTYDKPGTYEYFCAIHNSMTGKVTVA